MNTNDSDHEATDQLRSVGDEEVLERAPIRRNVQHMLSSQMVTWALTTVLAVVMPRILGPDSAGEMRLAYSLWLIAGVLLVLGTTMYLQLEIARRARSGLRLVGPVLVIRTIAWAVALVAIIAYSLVTESDGSFTLLLVVVGAGVLLNVWSDVLGAAFTGLERMSVPAAIGVESKFVYAVSVIGLLLLGTGVWGVAVAGVLSYIWGLVRFERRYRQVGRIVYAGWTRSWRPILRASAPFMAATTAIVVYQQVDVLVISWTASSRDLGWYSAAEVLVGTLLAPATVLFAAIFPSLGRLHELDKEAMAGLVRRTFSLLILVSVPVGFGTMVVAPSFVPKLYGEAFSGAGDALVAFGPMIILTSCTILLGAVALAADRGSFWVVVVFACAALTIPLDLILVPWSSDRFDNGAIGGAISYGITETLQVVVGLTMVAPYLLQRATVWRTVRILAAGGLMLACTWPVRDAFLAVPIALGAAVYVVAVLLFRVVGDEEKGLLLKVIKRGG